MSGKDPSVDLCRWRPDVYDWPPSPFETDPDYCRAWTGPWCSTCSGTSTCRIPGAHRGRLPRLPRQRHRGQVARSRSRAASAGRLLAAASRLRAGGLGRSDPPAQPRQPGGASSCSATRTSPPRSLRAGHGRRRPGHAATWSGTSARCGGRRSTSTGGRWTSSPPTSPSSGAGDGDHGRRHPVRPRRRPTGQPIRRPPSLPLRRAPVRPNARDRRSCATSSSPSGSCCCTRRRAPGKSSLARGGSASGARPSATSTVLPTIRVGHEPPAGARRHRRPQPVLAQHALSLEEGRRLRRQARGQRDLAAIHAHRLPPALCATRLPPARIRACVFDQFEELFTLDPDRPAAEQVGVPRQSSASRSGTGAAGRCSPCERTSSRSSIPTSALMPTRFGHSLPAGPLRAGGGDSWPLGRRPRPTGVDVHRSAADRLVDDLRRVHVQRGRRDRGARPSVGAGAAPGGLSPAVGHAAPERRAAIEVGVDVGGARQRRRRARPTSTSTRSTGRGPATGVSET